MCKLLPCGTCALLHIASLGSIVPTHAGGNSMRRPRHTIAGRDRISTQADGACGRAADALAHHENLRPLWAS